MAALNAVVGKTKAFTGADVVTCKLSEMNRKGVQIVAIGFDIEDATVTVVLPGEDATEQQPTELETSGNKTCIVGRNFSMQAIKISGLPTGSYSVLFVQL